MFTANADNLSFSLVVCMRAIGARAKTIAVTAAAVSRFFLVTTPFLFTKPVFPALPDISPTA
jgi:stage V sporulation protein SpoVS